MFYVTGDTHAHFEALKEALQVLPLAPGDGCIILGDVGFNYFRNEKDRRNKQFMESLGIPLLCVHGNHECRPAHIPTYTLQPWQGGQVWVEPEFPHLLFAKDGEIYTIDGKSVLVIGGAYSIDKIYRLANGYAWWPDEQPDETTRRQVEARLAAHQWQVDVILSHTCPAGYIPREIFPPAPGHTPIDCSTERWLDQIETRTRYNRWYCGHWHTNLSADRIRFLYHDIVCLE